MLFRVTDVNFMIWWLCGQMELWYLAKPQNVSLPPINMKLWLSFFQQLSISFHCFFAQMIYKKLSFLSNQYCLATNWNMYKVFNFSKAQSINSFPSISLPKQQCLVPTFDQDTELNIAFWATMEQLNQCSTNPFWGI